MDVTAEMQKIMAAIVSFAQKTQDEAKLTELIRLTKGFLYILDVNKTAEYRIAIIEEYLQLVASIISTINVAELLDYLEKLSTQEQRLVVCSDICKVIVQFFDPEKINPNLVTFWLDRSCDLQEIKSMSALMLFLKPEQQINVLAYDKNIFQDPRMQILKKCLAKL